MQSKKIFLTGGTGFFGKSILSMLLRGFGKEYFFTILSRNPEHFLQNYPEFAGMMNVRFIAGDVKNFVFPSEKFDYIIHAATPAVADLPVGEMRRVILEGTRHVLDFAGCCGPEKILFTSSGAVYGVQPPEVEHISEDFPCNPVTEYGIAKLEAEEMLQKSGMYSCIARCFAFTGQYLNRDIHFAIGNFIRDVLRGMDIVINGDGTPYRSYLHADDLVRWLFAILERGKDGVPYNVGSDEAVSIGELAQIVKETLHSSGDIVIRNRPSPGVPASRYVPSVKRAGDLGLLITIPLREAIRLSV